MAQIIDFSSARASRPARPLSSHDQCEIHFFLGVRYERMPDAPASPEPSTNASQTRRVRKRRA